MASGDQLANPKTGLSRFPTVALNDVGLQGHPIIGARGAIAAANGTTVLISRDGKGPAAQGSGVGSKGQVFFTSMRIVNGGTAWTGGTLTIQDTAGNVFLTVPSSALTANASINSATAGVTVGPAYNGGGAVGEGVVAVVAGYAAGSAIQIVADAYSLS